MKRTSSHSNSCLYPHPLSMNIKAHTREHLYSRTYARTHKNCTRNALNSNCLNFGFLYECGIIIPSPLRTRLIVGIGAISLILRLLLWSKLFSHCVHFACKRVIINELCVLLVRVPYYRVLCVSCVCEFWGLWLYV